MKNIAISLVIYKNDIQQISKVINSCFKSEELIEQFYLINNSPNNEIRRHITHSKIYYIFNGANLGYGKAHNLAIRKSIESGVKYHIVINPDIYFKKGTIEKINNYMEKNNDIGNIMPRVFYPDGSLQYICKLLPTPYDWIGRRFNPFRKMVDKRNELFELKFTGYNKIMDVPYLSGCFMFIRVDALKKVGLFDEKIFMYGEDTDLCRRFIREGYRTVYYPKVNILHEFQKGSHNSIRLTWIGIKSAIYYFNKWGWFVDKERLKINNGTLRRLNYKK